MTHTYTYIVEYYPSDGTALEYMRIESTDRDEVYNKYLRTLFGAIGFEDQVMSMFKQHERADMVKLFMSLYPLANTHRIAVVHILHTLVPDFTLTQCHKLVKRLAGLHTSYYFSA